MALKRLSLRTSTIIGVLLMGLLFILLSWLAGNYFRQAALEAQTKSLSRIIEVASFEVLRELQRHAINLGASLNSGNALQEALQSYQKTAQAAPLITLLDDPFITGFAGYIDVELTRLRLYDLSLKPLVESGRGISDLPFALPLFLQQQAAQRRGVERLKALGGLWRSSKGPLYSVLLPVGGLAISGYLEVVFDPRYSLHKVSEMTSMPVTILLPDEAYTVTSPQLSAGTLLPIEYDLVGNDGQAAYRMIGLEDINKLHHDMLRTQRITVFGFIALIFLIMLLALWLLRLGLFNPLRELLAGIERYSHDELDVEVRPGGLKELHTLGVTFNEMLGRLRESIRELERHSTLDGLTGIANRRYFDNCLQHEWSRCQRHQSPLSLLFIDIDYFKRYNDRYGHLNGDDTLHRVAQAIASMAKRSTDVAARLGGEEFVVLLPDTELENARLVAENLRLAIDALEIAHLDSEVSDQVTLSIGVACMVPAGDTTAERLIGNADKALYQAKEQGRNRVVVFAEAPKGR